ncbi:hypothetical protein SADUNF_Sadunf16G0047900 [Salix dunnii]|uniref:Uncharacterized protein n=1 Tax=Salix dunnii TaxID=1413687 RepID=A0A835JAF0_9ROSI|nr:hypothetical protein SADUNF_Sadunf16G0047900 [Salix dunnii]
MAVTNRLSHKAVIVSEPERVWRQVEVEPNNVHHRYHKTRTSSAEFRIIDASISDGLGTKDSKSQSYGQMDDRTVADKEIHINACSVRISEVILSDGDGGEHRHPQQAPSIMIPAIYRCISCSPLTQLELVGYSIVPSRYAGPNPAGMVLPLEMAEEPYHGILRLKQSREMAELEKKVMKGRMREMRYAHKGKCMVVSEHTSAERTHDIVAVLYIHARLVMTWTLGLPSSLSHQPSPPSGLVALYKEKQNPLQAVLCVPISVARAVCDEYIDQRVCLRLRI